MNVRSLYKLCCCILIFIVSLFVGVPSAPRDLQVKDTTDQSITVTWSPPEDDGGKPVTNYVIEWKLEKDTK